MSQFSQFELANEDLKALKKSKISLANAFERLDSISAAMERAHRLEHQVGKLTQSVDELAALAHDTLSRAFFSSFMDRIGLELDIKINKLFDIQQANLESILSQKVNIEDFHDKLREKAGSAQFDILKQMIAKQQDKLDNFIYWKFDPYREKIKEKINGKADIEDITRIESKLHSVDYINQLTDQIQTMQQELNNLLLSENEEEDEDEFSVDGLLGRVEKQFDEKDFKSVLSSEGRTLSQSIPGTHQPTPRTIDIAMRKNSILSGKQSSSGRKKTLGGVARQVEKLQTDLYNMVRDSESLRNSINQSTSVHNEKLVDLDMLTKDIDTRTQKMIGDWTDVKENKYQVEKMKNEVNKNAKEAGLSMHKIIHEFTETETDKLKRIKRLEIANEIQTRDIEKLKTLQKDKMNECIKAIHIINNQQENSLKDHKSFLDNFNKFQASLEKEINDVKSEIFEVKGPLSSLVTHKFIENEVLCEDIKRQQDVFRSLLEDYANSIDSHKANPPSSVSTRDSVQKYYEHIRLKKENLKLRASNLTPSGIFRPTTAASQFCRRSLFSRSEAEHDMNASVAVIDSGKNNSTRPSRQGSSLNTSRETPRLRIRDSGSVLSIK